MSPFTEMRPPERMPRKGQDMKHTGSHHTGSHLVKGIDAVGFASLIVAAAALFAEAALPISDALALGVFAKAFETAAFTLLFGRLIQIIQRLSAAPRTPVAARAPTPVTRLAREPKPVVELTGDRKAA